MKHKKLMEVDPLAGLVKEELMDVPSAEFSDKLLHASMTSYRISYSTRYRKEERLGKAILVILIFFNVMMFYRLNLFDINPGWLLISLPFVVGLGVLVKMNIQVAKKLFAERKF
ncbi:hypothetical protein OQX61_12305 [Pedobacter sp. PLR]|uniref:hypothetical protein n=1 Tax=Pedobacter sp. PLR TaxID=2994465 RepID=UPI00224853FB|nr:hypothetical protein [Pedobacter sp. PLR]MCX2452045.1 hypothetical protein [Pedobacter sp. PLR]